MSHAFACQLIKRAMQRYRIWGRQRTVNRSLRRHKTNGANTCSGMTKMLPDLPGECGDGCLAASAGDNGDIRGLARIKPRSRKRQQPARMRRCNKHRAIIVLRRVSGNDSNRTCGNRLVDKARTIGLCTGKREEHIACFHMATVHSKTANRNLGGLRVNHNFALE